MPLSERQKQTEELDKFFAEPNEAEDNYPIYGGRPTIRNHIRVLRRLQIRSYLNIPATYSC
jgi:hypothetical protein